MMHMRKGHLVRHPWVTALGLVLCVLPFLFAVEAKMAWYSPAGSASAQISSAKLQPADTPKLIGHAFGAFAPPAPLEDVAPVVIALLCIATVSVIAQATPDRLKVSASPSFSISLFFRPPPSL